jgi:hypothetical protein
MPGIKDDLPINIDTYPVIWRNGEAIQAAVQIFGRGPACRPIGRANTRPWAVWPPIKYQGLIYPCENGCALQIAVIEVSSGPVRASIGPGWTRRYRKHRCDSKGSHH